jgi:hypothetical protein
MGGRWTGLIIQYVKSHSHKSVYPICEKFDGTGKFVGYLNSSRQLVSIDTTEEASGDFKCSGDPTRLSCFTPIDQGVLKSLALQLL